MDSEIAKQLLLDGGTFVILGVPEGTEFGIDMKVWITGEKFRGIKMIPPGIHYIHYSPLNNYGEVMPKLGFFYNFRKSEFMVRKWNTNLQCVSKEQIDEREVVNLKDNITALDKFLGPYPYDIWNRWILLSSHITDNLIRKLTPESGQIQAVLDMVSCSDADRPRKSNNKSEKVDDKEDEVRRRSSTSEDLLPNLQPLPGTKLRFTDFPNQNYPEGSSPAEITKHSLDLSYTLETMMKQHSSETDLMGELQFCYLCFLVGHSLEAFENWTKLVSLICSCEEAIRKYRTSYDIFISTIEVQINETPEDFLADIVSNNNIVYNKLRNLFRIIQESDLDGRLKTKVQRFKQNLTNKYEWDFSHLESEDEEDAPVIVDLEN